ncbi:hypothetical protein C8A00DRAFT_31359 [Chaetomidium leptoderma]|uniref:RING-type domain-containing protein n=1 Tax=Chaetomidium leptoderma TaxID=669021 RepID=A0AAN6VT46_9PEZI|nr:hypothetical protein C8A00DRAFT_31359 [Chaetomidium leptoderma]
MANPGDDENCYYMPDPRYTFLCTDTDEIKCVICKHTKLSLPQDREQVEDSNPSFLPCGHVFGKKCLDVWLKTNNTCPICRFKLRHELCKHPISPRRLTKETYIYTPTSIPCGGTIPVQCHHCRRETDQKVGAELCIPLARTYYDLKNIFERTGSEAYGRAMAQAEKDLDKLMVALTPPEDRQW